MSGAGILYAGLAAGAVAWPLFCCYIMLRLVDVVPQPQRPPKPPRHRLDFIIGGLVRIQRVNTAFIWILALLGSVLVGIAAALALKLFGEFGPAVSMAVVAAGSVAAFVSLLVYVPETFRN